MGEHSSKNLDELFGQPEQAGSAPGNALSVLIVDGLEEERRRFRHLLEGAPGATYEILESETGQEALAVVLERRPDCILLSSVLPDMDAMQFLDELAQPADPRPPAVIVTGTDPASVVDALRAGAQEFLSKSAISANELRRAIAYALQRQASAELRRRLEMSERMATLGQLAAGVAHEVNNPAAYALTNLSQLTSQIRDLAESLTVALGSPRDSASPAAQRCFEALENVDEMVNDSLEGVRRINEIMRELQQFARCHPQQARWTDLSQVAHTAVRLTENRLRHRCRVETEIEPTLRFVADEGKLVQIAINLIDNASKAIEIGHEDNFIRISTGADSARSWLVVEDTGRGVPRHIEARIFDPFFTTGSREGGTGLGLTLSLEYARGHNGDLSYERRHPRGARFTLTIPRDTELSIPVARAPMRSETVPIAINRILLIDDEPAILRAYRRVLEPSYSVTVATTAKAAFDLLDDGSSFDAVICDVNMPELSGVEFYRRLELRDPDLARRVVFCSGGVFGEATREFIEATRNPVLHKPLAPEALLDAVNRFLHKRRIA